MIDKLTLETVVAELTENSIMSLVDTDVELQPVIPPVVNCEDVKPKVPVPTKDVLFRRMSIAMDPDVFAITIHLSIVAL